MPRRRLLDLTRTLQTGHFKKRRAQGKNIQKRQSEWTKAISTTNKYFPKNTFKENALPAIA